MHREIMIFPETPLFVNTLQDHSPVSLTSFLLLFSGVVGSIILNLDLQNCFAGMQ